MKHYLLCFTMLLSSVLSFGGIQNIPTRNAVVPINDVYSVATAEDLEWIAEASKYSDFAGKTILLTADIDLRDLGTDAYWKMIGSADFKFNGLFDGQCHTIKNITINAKSIPDGIKENAGFFCYIGANGIVKNLALTSGSVFIENVNNAGSIAGVNEGEITGCFNTIRVTMSGGSNIGGLVGKNLGVINNCYNVGVVADGLSKVGGLTGSNSGTIKNTYVAAYVKGSSQRGAVTGENVAGSKWDNVYFDQQIGLTKAIGDADIDGVNVWAFSHNNPDWDTFINNANAGGDVVWEKDDIHNYPQLSCFKQSHADLSDVSTIVADFGVEGNMAKQYADNVDKDFYVWGFGSSITWSADEGLKFDKYGAEVKVDRPCQDGELYMTATKNSWAKEVLVKLKGFETFNAGIMKSLDKSLCVNEYVAYKDLLSPAPSKGKDDKKNEDLPADEYAPYVYWMQAWKMLEPNGDGTYKDSIRIISDTLVGDKAFQDKIFQPEDEKYGEDSKEGIYRFRLMAHDSKCQIEFIAADGYADVGVAGVFEAGAINAVADTIWGGLPATINIAQEQAATGGGKPYDYLWFRIDEKNNRATTYAGEGESLNCEFDVAGRYTIIREVKDNLCVKEFYNSGKYDDGLKEDLRMSSGEKHIVVFSDISAGEIQSNNDMRCGTTQTDVIIQTAPVTGGTPELSVGQYVYRWTCNGVEISGETSATLSLANQIFEKGKSYSFRREVKDNSGHFDWVQSAGEYVIGIIEEFIVGQIDEQVDTIYGNLPQTRTIAELVPVSGGQGAYSYQWKQNGNILTTETDTTLTVDFNTVGTYTYMREVKDEFCSTEYTPSIGEKKIYVFDNLTAGKIEDVNDKTSCDLQPTILIRQTEGAKGGCTPYLYRWYCNDVLVAGAESATLNLADMQFEAGKDYTFRREVKDRSSFSSWTKSEGEYKIHIYTPFSAGAIKEVQENKCVDNRQDANLTVTIAEQAPAKGDEQINYQWKLYEVSDGKRHDVKTYTSDEISFNGGSYTFNLEDWPAIPLPAAFSLVREAQNPICSSQWEEAEGEIRVMFGRNGYRYDTINPCPLDLPFAYTYTYMDGHQETHQFTANNETFKFDEGAITGCSDAMVVSCVLYPAPQVEVDNLGNVCQNSTSITVPIKILQGRPSQYRVFFDDGLKALGLEDYEAQLFSPTEVEIETGALPMQQYSIGLQFYEWGAQHICPTAIDTVWFNINLAGFVHQKWNDILYVDNNPSNGFPTAEGDLRFVSFQWYKDGEPIEGATEQIYQEEFGLNGVYYVILTDEDGNVYRSCDVEARPGMGLAEIEIDWNDRATEIYTITGVRLSELPTEAGVYVVRYSAQGRMVTRKVIVK